MPRDPYSNRLLTGNPYASKSDVTGKLVAVLDSAVSGRKLELIVIRSRCVCRGEIHELLVAGEASEPGDVVEDCWGLGFLEIKEGGVLLCGDEVRIGDRMVGALAGFDLTHAPNHMNLVLKSPRPITGAAQGLRVGDRIVFSPEKAP
ncbi:MAG: hypothetical protein RDU89_08955 [bacterium]|nr:hypothetical protein [bacterium]